MNHKHIATVYRLCGETVKREIASAERSVERLRRAGLSTASEHIVIDRMTRVLTQFEQLEKEYSALANFAPQPHFQPSASQ